MKNRLRVRRLTLAPAARPENVAAEDLEALTEENCFLAMEHLERVSEVVQAAATRPKSQVVHGVEDAKGSRFWALESDSESSDAESVISIGTPEFIKQAQDVGFSISELRGAEKELKDHPIAEPLKEGTMAKEIIDALVRRRQDRRPWRGPLPAPRVSPPRTFEDALATAKVLYQGTHWLSF